MIRIKLITGLILAVFSISNTIIPVDEKKSTGIMVNTDSVYIDSITTANSTPSIQMFFYIKKYAEIYHVPEEYAFALAYSETRYMGPFHYNYNYALTSNANALGPMQIQLASLKYVTSEKATSHRLKTDIEFNVKISMLILRRFYELYGNWGLAFGAYSCGKPCINEYSKKILSKKYIWLPNNTNV